MRELLCHQGNPELFERRDLRRNQSKNRAVATRLFQIIASKTRRGIHLVGKIEITSLLENLPIPVSAEFTQHRGRLFMRKRLLANRRDVAMLSHFWWLTLADVQIRAALLDDYFQKLIERGHLGS